MGGFKINNQEWNVIFVNPYSDRLRRSDNVITLGVCDNTTKTIYISNNLSAYMKDKVLCHELCHAFAFENNCNFDLETEEIIADFMSLFGRDIIYTLDELMNILQKIS